MVCVSVCVCGREEGEEKGIKRFEPKFYECSILGLNPESLRSA